MSNKGLVLKQNITNIANNIRNNLGTSTTYTPSELATGVQTAVDKYKSNNPSATSTTGTCSNAYDVPCKEFVVEGNSEQDGTPTPDSPVAIEVVKGKNLLDSSPITSQTKNGVVITRNSDGSLTLKGTATATTDIRFAGGWSNTTPLMTMKAGETWRILDTASALTEGQFIVVNGSNHNVLLRSVTNNDDVRIVTEDANIYDIYLHFDNGAVIDTTIYPMIYKGEATTYLPYNTIEIEQRGKNIWHIEEKSIKTNGITFTKNDDESITISGTATSNAYLINTIDLSSTNLVNGNQYTMSSKTTIPSGMLITMELRNSSSTWLRQYQITNATQTRTFTIDLTNTSQIKCVVQINSGSTIDTTIYPQIESGTTATSYEPYQEPQTYQIPLGENYLAKVGSVQDKLVISRNGECKIEKNFEDITFKGTETFSFVDSNTRIMASSYSVPQLLNVKINTTDSVSNLTNALCSHYQVSTQNSITKGSNKIGFSQWSTAKYIYFPADYDTISDFTTWLSINKPIVYYQLATPTTETLTPTTQIVMYEGTNIFSIVSEGTPTMSIEYITKVS